MILLVEDNDEDHVAFERALADAEVQRPLHRCKNGDEALAYLARCDQPGARHSPALPALIVLDLNLPGSDGREVLGRLKQDPRLRAIPVVIVTTSSNPRDVYACYDRGANSYMVKSIDFVRFQRDVIFMIDYWFRASLLPATVEKYNQQYNEP